MAQTFERQVVELKIRTCIFIRLTELDISRLMPVE